MSYTLTLASLILLAGSLSDRWGWRRVFLAGLGWFTVASVLCAAAPGIGWLIAARAVQGIGGALMTPASLAIIEATPQPRDRTRAIGTWAGFSGISAVIAPFPGGWLLQAGSWRPIFLINVPVAAVTGWIRRRHVPESRDTPAPGRADWPGALAGAAALAAITYAIIMLPGGGVASPGFAAAAALAVGSSAAFALAERHRSHPMLPPAIFAPAQFRAANAVTFVVNGALGGFAFVFIPALQIIAGYSPVLAGSALVPVTAMTLLLPGPSGRLAQRIGPRPPLVTGCLVCAGASLLAVRIGAHAGSWTAVFPLALLSGLGLASLITAPDRQRDELRPRLPGGPGLRGEQRPRPAGRARQRSPAPQSSPPPSSPGPPAPPRHHGRRSHGRQCPTRPARPPSAPAPGQTPRPDTSQTNGRSVASDARSPRRPG
jgi:MFS family permease